jgi:HAD superfamily hydrolase (TIGR01509 family)
MKNRGVIFDMDGVLVDTEPIYVDITAGYLSSLGVHIPNAELYSSVGIPTNVTLSRLKLEYGLSKSAAELAREERQLRESRFHEMDSYPIISGVIELLDELNAAGLPCAIASSSSPEMISLILSKTGLGGYFKDTVSGEEVSNGKPAPDIFLEAARRLGVEPGACVVVEDSPHGIRGAIAAGMGTVGFQNPNSGNQDLSSADLIVDNFDKNCRLSILALPRIAATDN